MIEKVKSGFSAMFWRLDTRSGADARELAVRLLREHFGGGAPACHAGLGCDNDTGRPLASAPWLSWSRTEGAVLAALDAEGPVGCDV